jgi:prepilin-type N-terminal cleavage/methylation domain-containing protein
MKKTSASRGGFTLAEVIIALLLLSLTAGGTLSAFLMGRISSYHSRYHVQAMNLLQAKVEELSGGKYEDVRDQGPLPAIIDAGSDLEWGTADDLLGTLWVEVNDSRDLDGDGDTGEEEIDLDGDGINDSCKPVRVSLTWTCLSYGGDTPMMVSLETFISDK